MVTKPTYEELLKKIEYLEAENEKLKGVEARLIDREETLTAFMNATTESMSLSDKAGRILAINETAAKRVGKHAHELIGVKLKDIFPPEIDIPRRKIVDQVFQSGTPRKYQDERAGRIYDNSLFPVFDESGNVKAIASFTRDITKSVKTEMALKADATWRRVLMDKSRDGIVILDENGKVYEVNRRFAQMLGYTREELMRLHVWEWDDTWSQEELKRMIPLIDEEGNTLETRHFRKDGSFYDVEITSNGAVIDGKKLVFSVSRDITKRKQAENELKQAYEIMNKSPVVIFQWLNEKDLPVEFVSENVEKIFGYTPEEFRNRAVEYLDTVHPDDLEMVLRDSAEFEMRRGIDDFKPVPYRIKTKTGEIKWIEVLPFRRVDRNNLTTHYQSLVIDITERVKSEEERKKIEDQLRQSQKMEVVGTLASGVAHDLNNILSGIVSYPEIILMELPEDSPLRKPIRTIKQSGEKAAVIVQDLLTLARRGVPISQVLNLNDIITDLKTSPEFQNIRRYHPDVKVVFQLEMPLQNIKGSSIHISKSLLNLISNAAEAIEDKGRITVSTENIDIDVPRKGYKQIIEKGKYVTLRIEDTGAGISEKDLARIFEPFYTKKVMGRSGTGLGMPVVWGMVKDHKGYMDIKTTEGRGTTFILYFPVTDAVSTEKISENIDSYYGNGESILVVDDVFEQREIACVILEKLGYSASSVSSGEEAIDYLKKNNAALIILDMIMDPGIDGLETYKNIVEFKPKQKIIIASGYSETDKVKELQRLGGCIYVKKPYSMTEIGRAVKEELLKN